jgi:hypothetical protein
LENNWMGLDRLLLAAQSGDKGASRSLFLAHGISEWCPVGF